MDYDQERIDQTNQLISEIDKALETLENLDPGKTYDLMVETKSILRSARRTAKEFLEECETHQPPTGQTDNSQPQE